MKPGAVRFGDFERTVRPVVGELCVHARETLLAG